jgi:H+/Cl- antiporter ClcA
MRAGRSTALSLTDQPATSTPRLDARVLVLAGGLGVLGAVGGSAFLAVVEHAQHALFSTLPDALGLDGAPWWWSGGVLAIGALALMALRRLPGATGPGPLTGFHFDTPLRHAPSILLASFATLVCGMALGPEAALIGVGVAVGAAAMRNGPADRMRLAMFLGGIAAIGAVFGSPFVVAFMVLEMIALAGIPAMAIVPALVALAAGYLVQIGIWGWPGFGLHPLAVDGLPAYPAVRAGDLLVAAGVAFGAAAIAGGVRIAAERVDRAGRARPNAVLLGAALATAAVLAVAEVGFDVPRDLILFSGQSGMDGLLAQTSVGIVVVILVAKGVAYAAALGGGFRGGPIFPATFLGVAVGVLATLLVPSADASPLAATGIAAAAALMTRLPATSALLAALLISGTGPAIAPFAILGAVVGLVVRLAMDRRWAPPAATP